MCFQQSLVSTMYSRASLQVFAAAVVAGAVLTSMAAPESAHAQDPAEPRQASDSGEADDASSESDATPAAEATIYSEPTGLFFGFGFRHSRGDSDVVAPGGFTYPELSARYVSDRLIFDVTTIAPIYFVDWGLAGGGVATDPYLVRLLNRYQMDNTGYSTSFESSLLGRTTQLAPDHHLLLGAEVSLHRVVQILEFESYDSRMLRMGVQARWDYQTGDRGVNIGPALGTQRGDGFHPYFGLRLRGEYRIWDQRRLFADLHFDWQRFELDERTCVDRPMLFPFVCSEYEGVHNIDAFWSASLAVGMTFGH